MLIRQEITLKIILPKNRNITGDISPTRFMTDIVPQFYDAFSVVFNFEAIQLYCTWHLDKTFQKKTDIKNKKNFNWGRDL